MKGSLCSISDQLAKERLVSNLSIKVFSVFCFVLKHRYERKTVCWAGPGSHHLRPSVSKEVLLESSFVDPSPSCLYTDRLYFQSLRS